MVQLVPGGQQTFRKHSFLPANYTPYKKLLVSHIKAILPRDLSVTVRLIGIPLRPRSSALLLTLSSVMLAIRELPTDFPEHSLSQPLAIRSFRRIYSRRFW